MIETAESAGLPAARNRTVDLRGWLALAILCVACVYIWIVPLFKARGVYWWGYYGLPDVYIGIPLGLGTLLLAVVMFTPVERRRARALPLTALFMASMFALFTADFLYTVLVGKLFRVSPSDFWMDGIATAAAGNLPDPELGFVRKPNIVWKGGNDSGHQTITYGTDENGFRNPPGIRTADVCFIGDSYVEGANVPADKTFTALVGSATGMRTVNLGRGWHCPSQELIILKRYALAYKPKAIVWAIFEGNDLPESAMFRNWQKNPLQSQSLFRRYSHRSLLARFVPVRWPKRPDDYRSLKQPDGTTVSVNLDYPYQPEAPLQMPEAWQEIARSIEEGQRICRARGIQLLVLFLPIKSRILDPYIQYRGESDRAKWVPTGKLDDERDFDTAVGLLCKRIGCPFLDATGPLRERARTANKDLYTRNGDNHIAVEGHAVVAEALTPWVRSHVK